MRLKQGDCVIVIDGTQIHGIPEQTKALVLSDLGLGYRIVVSFRGQIRVRRVRDWDIVKDFRNETKLGKLL